MIVRADRRVICTWCRADVTPPDGLTDLDVVHCSRCGCTFLAGWALRPRSTTPLDGGTSLGQLGIFGDLGHDDRIREALRADPPLGDAVLFERGPDRRKHWV